jgi:glutamate 5-kinase
MDATYDAMAKDTTGSNVGTGGMATKLTAARIATESGADMIIANGQDVGILHQIIEGDFRGTLFRAQEESDFDISAYLLQYS